MISHCYHTFLEETCLPIMPTACRGATCHYRRQPPTGAAVEWQSIEAPSSRSTNTDDDDPPNSPPLPHQAPHPVDLALITSDCGENIDKHCSEDVAKRERLPERFSFGFPPQQQQRAY